MKRYILTGTPGCGKTVILRALELKGFVVIDEAATDIIALEQAQGNMTPWENPRFVDQIVNLQKQRQMQVVNVNVKLQFYDRSPICTYALAVYLKMKPSQHLLKEIDRIEKNQIYQKQVFFIDNLGFITPTEARRITYEEAVQFEKVHEEAYAKFGYDCLRIQTAPLFDRVNAILRVVEQGGTS
jgi:predicted ATPase